MLVAGRSFIETEFDIGQAAQVARFEQCRPHRLIGSIGVVDPVAIPRHVVGHDDPEPVHGVGAPPGFGQLLFILAACPGADLDRAIDGQPLAEFVQPSSCLMFEAGRAVGAGCPGAASGPYP